jgi:hypothetical protein
MNGCDRFEIAVEMRRHGALDAPAVAKLDAHLASCEACRRFDALSKSSEEAMQGAAAAIGRSMDWESARARVHSIVEAKRRTILRFALASGLLLAAVGWFEGTAAVVVTGACLALVLFVALSEQRDRARELARAEGAQEDMIAFYRNWLDRSFRAQRDGSWLTLAAGVLWLGAGALRAANADAPEREVAFAVGAGLFFLGTFALYRVVRMPRLLRERAELE